MLPFHVSKWYLDYVTDHGDVEIAYTGALKWGLVQLHYSSVLTSISGRIRQRHSLMPQTPPEQKDSIISWRSKALQVDTAWEAVSPAVHEMLYRSRDGLVEWNCFMPLARAKTKERSGMGYVEHLDLTIPPWKLPIRTLRWGRFTSASDYMTWIDWEGDFPLRVAYLNGEKNAGSHVDDDRVEMQDGTRLLMDRSLVLRDGALGTTALAAVPGIGKMFPVQLLQMVECKWRSRAQLERRDKPPVEGWAIHERVSWPR